MNENNMENRETLIEELDAVYSLPILPETKPLKDGAVIDEEKSARWNRERVKKSQRAYKEEMQRLRSERRTAIDEVEAKVARYIQGELIGDYSMDTCSYIFDLAYNRGHSNGSFEIMSCVDDYIDFLNTISAKESSRN